MVRVVLALLGGLLPLTLQSQSAYTASLADSLRQAISQARRPRLEFRARAALAAQLFDQGELDRARTEVLILQRQARRLDDPDALQLAQFYTEQQACLSGDTAGCNRFDSLATPNLLANSLLDCRFDFENLVGRLSNQVGRYSAALRWGNLILQYIGQNDQPLRLQASILRQMAHAAHNLGLDDRAFTHLDKALRIYRRLNDAIGLATAYYELGTFLRANSFSAPDQLRDAINYFLQADELLAGRPDRREGRCIALLGAADAYAELGQWPRVAELIRRVEGLASEMNGQLNPILEFNLLKVRSDWARAQNQPAEAVIALGQHMLNLGEASNNLSLRHLARYNLAEILARFRRWTEARPLLEGLLQEPLRADLQLDVLRLLAKICFEQNDWPAAARYYQQVSHLGDSLARSTNEQRSRQLAEQYSSELKDLQIARQQAQLERRNWQVAAIAGGLLLMVILALALVRGRARLSRLNRSLSQRNEFITQQNRLLADQNLKIEDSIRYASRIQHAVLPEPDWLERVLPPHFVFYKPKDIVSGDFYWAAQQSNCTLLAAVDCTGHGVPGAFMSVVGYNLLNQIVLHEALTDPAAILHELDRRIALTLRQSPRGENQDGMDVALLVLEGPDPQRPTGLRFAGARRPILLAYNDGIRVLDGNRFACGGALHVRKHFDTHRIELTGLRALWIFSDGLTDQFGPWDPGRQRLLKLGLKRLSAWMAELAHLPPPEAHTEIEKRFTDWMNGNVQLDDVLAIGLQLPKLRL